jgi:hypothetical protein
MKQFVARGPKFSVEMDSAGNSKGDSEAGAGLHHDYNLRAHKKSILFIDLHKLSAK